MHRYELSDQQWTRVASLFPQHSHPGKAGRPPGDHRPIVNGILWVLHTGAPWRDLPERYGPWQTIFYRFNGWRQDGTWSRIATALLDELDAKGRIDHDLWCIDGSVIRASRAAAGAGKKNRILSTAGGTSGDANARAIRPCVGTFSRRLRYQGPPGLRQPRLHRGRPRHSGAGPREQGI